MVNGWQRSTRAFKATEITTIELGQFKTGNGELISINQFEILKNMYIEIHHEFVWETML